MRRARQVRRASVALGALEAMLAAYGGTASAEKRRLLAEIGALRVQRASDLIVLQRIVCFLSAFPDDAAVYRAARRLAAGFAARTARLPRRERDSLDDSGTSGTCTRHFFAATGARWMQSRAAGAVDIDWKAENAADAVAALVIPKLDPAEAEVVDLSAAALRKWLGEARGGRGTDLAFLLQQAGDGATRREFDRVFDASEVPLAWRLADRDGITGNALRCSIASRQAGLRRASGDARAAIMQPIEVQRLSRREATRLLDVWRAALWSRTRTVFQIEQPNLDDCLLADLGSGLSFAAIGVAPDRRGVLEATYGQLLLANGIPVGYGGFTTLFAQVNTGINVFPEFRGSEAAFAFEQALRVMHAVTGNARFIINPYQFGAGNDEALASGAYWFYYRLGFRSAEAPVRALAERESARIRAERRYRVPIATLRKLAACDLYLDLAADAGAKFFDESWLQPLARGITAAIAREGIENRARALQRMCKRIAATLDLKQTDFSGLERRGLAQFAPILAQIDDLDQWPKVDRGALGDLVRARWAVQERDFIARMREHDRLRNALARAAQRPQPTQR